MPKSNSFTARSLRSRSNKLAILEPVFARILESYGYPPFWSREPTYETLVRIILEQQVSLASAKTTFDRIHAEIEVISPARVLNANENLLKSCGVSRQKVRYIRELAVAVNSGSLDIDELARLPDEIVHHSLTAITGIGQWTSSVFLMLALHRADHFPVGDLALINSLKHEFAIDQNIDVETIIAMSDAWRPNRTIASFLLWHAYIQRKGSSKVSCSISMK